MTKRIVLVRFSGSITFAPDLAISLEQKGMKVESIDGRLLDTELPPCDVIIQTGLDEPPDEGFVLLKRVRALAPDTPILVCSGHDQATMSITVHDLAKAKFIHRDKTVHDFGVFVQAIERILEEKNAP